MKKSLKACCHNPSNPKGGTLPTKMVKNVGGSADMGNPKNRDPHPIPSHSSATRGKKK